MPALLLEIGLEEIPAGMVDAAQAELERSFRALAQRERLDGDGFAVTSYSTPRRLAIVAEGLLARQADIEEQVLGPSAKIAYKDGALTPAALAFAKKNGVTPDALTTVTTPKGEYLQATVRRAGQTAAEVLTAGLPGVVSATSWPKNMAWRAGRPEKFVRPVRWLLALLDEEVLPVEFAGVWAGNVSYGHRVLHGDAPVVVGRPGDYATALEEAFVQVDAAARKHRIRKALDAAARTVPGARWREDEELVATVTNLTEWPSVLVGGFDRLRLPDEVLVTVMRDHQKYFALEDAEGRLLPHFLAVLNIETDTAGAAVIRHGNERVLRARFNDAQFFWDVDQKIPLEQRVELLKHVTFQKELGSYWDKTERNSFVVAQLQASIGLEDESSFYGDFYRAVLEATRFAKADLTTEMVKEFPELQGNVGGLYAKAQGLHDVRGRNILQTIVDEVAEAIYDHYKPMSASDSLPRNRTGCVVAIADRISTIIDMFAIGQQPTGSTDRFALRRAGNGVVRIMVEKAEINGNRLHLGTFYQAGIQGSKIENDPDMQVLVYEFLLDRLEYYLQDTLKVRLQVARSVRNSRIAGKDHANEENPVGYSLVAGFARELNAQVGSAQVLAVAELLKRVSNILRQAREKGIQFPNSEAPGLLQDAAEKELAERVTAADIAIQTNYRDGNYGEVIATIAGLREPLNAFFDSVMVMMDDSELRANRLALLARTEAVVRWAADFSELASIAGAA